MFPEAAGGILCPSAPEVRFEDVRVRAGGRAILEGVDAVAPAGGATVLVGPNGAGKTTLLHCLLGETPYAGRIVMEGGRRMAHVPQQLVVERGLPLSVLEFLALGGQRRPLWLGVSREARERAHALLASVDAAGLARQRLGDLSGGELRRVLLAAALGHEPDLLVLDEAEAGVDVHGERLFWEVLDAARRARGFTLIMVSHNLPLAAHYATHVICLKKRVLAEGSPRETLTAPLLLSLFGVPIHLYPDQCDLEGPACPQCGALSAPGHRGRLPAGLADRKAS
ncbi:metal ABC transporter ATP-binding protein [Desulfovibrio sp.]|uniref:metal ABC transporter ATP-binding protein n=1 Tax=Desulfovibrio sp. TaxID=885 RepID=UPI0023CAED5F|nr:metal ABC transporter ATP-binding protein [Desulfovibrio sp.]MDE7240324.1 metal ABC transporter ATP-binding protein [Desulfovibrio sp.]